MNIKKSQTIALSEQGKLSILVFRLVIVSLFLWNLAFFLAPIFASSSIRLFQLTGGIIYFFIDPVCHQIPQRSLFLNGLPMPVCARCFAIYISAFIILVYTMLKNRLILWPGWIYFIIILLVGLEIGSEKLDLIQNSFELRMLSGLLLGILFAHLFMESIFYFSGKEKNG